ncbi:acetyl-CoA carboxylase, carboxyltransferase subunit beta [Saccharopolyspora rosea]|uniref:Multifunctional fusion protein n=1 Tax=Saccharopolyspora rosea TaxID=524884 RepID=A0ABW3FP39_9PSEU|nr:acetyl-CoA carboxylase, carboxyltransferase subunit beta [Saccharopolyspora rosea]
MSRTRTSPRRTEPATWVLCPSCATPYYGKRWAELLRVCAECGHHDRLTAWQRLEQLSDPGHLELLDSAPLPDDPLGFVDTRPYPERLAEARDRTGLDEAVLCARIRVLGTPAIAAVMDFGFMGGSLGSAVGERITAAAETALAERVPLLLVTASGGARMQEGALSLMQMARTSIALEQLNAAGILTASLITDPTYGGVAASFAAATDVVVAEPGARMGFAGRRVIEQTIRQQLPPGFQTAEFLAERGFVDLVVPRSGLRRALGKLLAVGAAAADESRRPPLRSGDPGVGDPDLLPEPAPWDQVRGARDLDRPTALDYFAQIFEDFQELRGDRLSGDCPSVVAGTAWLDGRPVIAIGQQKGHDPAELRDRNFGMPAPAGYRKAARLMRLADKLGLPVVALVDTPGAYPGAAAEEQGQAFAIAENLRLMAALRVPVVTAVIGEGGSGGALALAVADRVLMFSGATYSVISPEGCAAILWNAPEAAAEAAAALGLTARDLLRHGIVEAVIPEPPGGTGADPALAADRLGAAIRHHLGELVERPPEAFPADRHRRFRALGAR